MHFEVTISLRERNGVRAVPAAEVEDSTNRRKVDSPEQDSPQLLLRVLDERDSVGMFVGLVQGQQP